MRYLRAISAGIIVVLTAVVLVTVMVTLALGAEEKKPPAKKEKVTINGDHWKMQGDSDARIYTFTGNVAVKYQDTTLTADRAVYTKKTETVVVDGNLKIVDPENEITGEKGVAYLDDRKCVLDGNVKLVTKPKRQDSAKDSESVRSQLHEPTTITCDKLEYLYRKKIATAEGNLKITQKDRVLEGSKAVYDVKQELVTMTGGVRIRDEKGQTFTASGIVKASLKEGAEWIEAENGSATVEVDIEGETSAPEKAPEKK